VLASSFRFSVEFLRLNPRLLFGLSEAQLFALLLMIAGAVLFLLLMRRPAAGADAAGA
jgi:prolipoprotein diacylglyceryltransferase